MSIGVTQRKLVRVLFDETHSESWTISRERAAQMNPEYPEQSSYQKAADLLSARDFILERHMQGIIGAEILKQTDVLALFHPCDPHWEKTVPGGTPRLAPDEVAAIQKFVAEGGGLLVITEYEHDKYGDNLNELLAPFGLQIENTTVLDKEHCRHTNPAWILSQRVENRLAERVAHRVHEACFYQAGSCAASGNGAVVVLRSSEKSSPPQAGLLAVAEHGKGRVAVLADSLIFGDEHLEELDHAQLWLNLNYWLAAPAFARGNDYAVESEAAQTPAWRALKTVVNQLRQRQNPDGSVPKEQVEVARGEVAQIQERVRELTPRFAHQKEYLEQVVTDLGAWVESGLGKPDFRAALELYRPEKDRRNNRQDLVLFPMYTPNASLDTRLEALIVHVPWPDWIAQLEKTLYSNDKYVPVQLVDYTEGYNSECAVLFPETVSISGKPINNFGGIFCDRESRRFQAYVRKAIAATNLPLHPDLECLLNSLPLIQDTYILWDLVHDRSHALGELPFDPFLIRQRAPYWMYALEELRVDLNAFREAVKLSQNGFPFARYVTYAILFDRIFRFAIVGTRVKNYDGLGGQILFAFLHHKGTLRWMDGRLFVDWEGLADAVEELRQKILKLYHDGADCSKVAFWIDAHDLISEYIKPNVASVWKKEARAINNETDAKKWIDLVCPDEFPLGNFHLQLQKKVLPVTY
jgi:hypothetical protein